MEATRLRTGSLAIISVMAVVFALALAFATLQIPVILSAWLSRFIPDIHPAIEPERVAEFMRIVRPIGYGCLVAIALLIVAGLVMGRKKLAVFGSLAFFLPTFGHFFASMFFLAGLGILRIPFIPFWDPGTNLMRLGDISYLPYMALVYPFWLAGVDIRVIISWIAVGLGLFMLVLGTLTWLHGRLQGRETVDFWIYRHTRHPQYLGFIIWSYGVMLIAAQQAVPMGGSNPGASLPWLLTSLVIICVALAEENRMRKEDSERYLQYAARAPFMFPVPGFVANLMTAPLRVLLRKARPETGGEILATFAIYATLLILLSLPFILLDWPTGIGWSSWPAYVPGIP